MSIWVRLFKGVGRVTAVYYIGGGTYVEIKPNSKALWAAICDRCERLNAQPVLAD
jgi:hypothetical protein